MTVFLKTHLYLACVCVCIFFCVSPRSGGFAAVIYTDSIQTLIIVGGAFSLMFIGTAVLFSNRQCSSMAFDSAGLCVWSSLLQGWMVWRTCWAVHGRHSNCYNPKHHMPPSSRWLLSHVQGPADGRFAMARNGVWSHHPGNVGLVHRSGDCRYLLEARAEIFQIDEALNLVIITHFTFVFVDFNDRSLCSFQPPRKQTICLHPTVSTPDCPRTPSSFCWTLTLFSVYFYQTIPYCLSLCNLSSTSTNPKHGF